MTTPKTCDSIAGMVSIIVPVYNAAQFIEKCLDHLLKQTYDNLEVIVVDDGSEDDSRERIQRICEADRRVRYFYQENAGVSAARNLALGQARGEYIGFCDSDDWAEADMYEVLLKNMREYDADVSVVQFFWNRANGDVFTPHGNDSAIEEYTPEEAFAEMCIGKRFRGQLWNKLLHRSVINETRFDERISICEDVLFLAEILPNAKKVIFENSCKYHYLELQSSAMNKPYSNRFMTRRSAYLKIIEICRRNRYEKAFPYVCRAFIDGDLSIAQKMCAYQQFDENTYKTFKTEIKQYRKATKSITNCKRRIEEWLFISNINVYKLFVLMMKAGL